MCIVGLGKMIWPGYYGLCAVKSSARHSVWCWMLIYNLWQLLNRPQVQSIVSAEGASVTSLPLLFALQRVPNESCSLPPGSVSVCQLLSDELDRQTQRWTYTQPTPKFCLVVHSASLGLRVASDLTSGALSIVNNRLDNCCPDWLSTSFICNTPPCTLTPMVSHTAWFYHNKRRCDAFRKPAVTTQAFNSPGRLQEITFYV